MKTGYGKTVVKVVMGLMLVLFLAGNAFAWPSWTYGKPQYKSDKSFGYFMWRTHDRWHVRVCTKGGTHTFYGTIKCDGPIRLGDSFRLNSGDYVRNSDPNTIEFRITCTGDVMGFGVITPGKNTMFDLSMDDHQIHPNEIHIGGESFRPSGNPFSISDIEQ
ncbi:MAG: hypothetical protein LWY06_09090 [Firmicutes bacterium]|nr:hypothetical protein [Bacillota bacterium]